VAHVRLQAVEGQYDMPLRLGDPLETGRVGERECDEFVVPIQEVQHGPRGNGDAATLQVLMDLRDTPVVGIT
jgi:hypothetical protein